MDGEENKLIDFMHISIHVHTVYINMPKRVIEILHSYKNFSHCGSIKATKKKKKKERKERNKEAGIRSVRVAFIKTGLGTVCKGRMR